jgi:hypothetical protein
MLQYNTRRRETRMSTLNQYTNKQLFEELLSRGLEDYDNEGQAVIYTGIYNLEENNEKQNA